MNIVRTCSVVCILQLLLGCATSGSTDPRDDSLSTAIKCTFTSDCDNFNKDKERDLEAERDETRRLEALAASADSELKSNQAQIDALQRSLDELDSSITRLRKQADEASFEAGAKKDEIAVVKNRVNVLQEEADRVEANVLKEDISVKQAEQQKTVLVRRQNELESLLQTILSSQ